MNKKTGKLNFAAVAAAIKTLRQIRKGFLPVLLLDAVLESVKPFIPIVFSAKILDELIGAKDVPTLIALTAAMVGLTLVLHILSGYAAKRYSDEKTMLVSSYYIEISKKSMKLDYEQVENPETMDLIQQIEETENNHLAIWDMAEYLLNGFLATFEMAIASVLIVSTFANGRAAASGAEHAVIQSPFAFLALAALLIAGVFIYNVVQAKIGKTAEDDVNNNLGSNRHFNYLFFRISYNYECGKDIRLYQAQDMLKEKIDHYVDPDVLASRDGFVKPNIKHFSILAAVNTVLLTAVYLFIILKAYAGAITVGSIFIQINAIMRFYQAIARLIQQYTMFKVASEYFTLSIRYFALPETEQTGTKKISIGRDDDYTFEFHDVSFRYPFTDALALEHINLTIAKGQRLAVVGMNGAGKTTLIKLLCRFYQPTEGVITCNGVDIQTFDYNDYINLFSVVFQDFNLFSFALDQNIAAGEQADKARLEKSLKDAGLGELIKELKSEYGVYVGKHFDEKGRDFSGGEKQKIAIARALYKDAPIVVLDEPTAALDPITEFEIYSKFNTLVGGKASVFISHRLSSCKFCHTIAVFDGGRIVQLGSHNDLLADKKGKYFELWNAQAKHYVSEDIPS
ncbi:MAG: ABC transporter ATP-binding protein [Clostridiaceae bacterium]